jgi:GTP-binding protein EngB required for normal cell division
MKLELKKFDPSTIKSDSVIVFIGKRNTGKSYCMKDILSYHKELPVGVVISPTEAANNFFEKFVPNMLIYMRFARQKQII